MKECCITINENELYYYLEKKKIKNINIRIKTDGKIFLSCPLKIKIEQAEKFLIQKYSWIIKHQKMIKEYFKDSEDKDFKEGSKKYFLGKLYKLKIIPSKNNNIKINDENINLYIKEKYIQNQNYVEKYYEKCLKEISYKLYNKLVIKYQNQMIKYVKNIPQIEIKKLKTRWGSCNPMMNKVTFNLSLIKTPIELIEYVVVHELAHFQYQDHSKKFYILVERYIPNWKIRRKLLNSKYNIVI